MKDRHSFFKRFSFCTAAVLLVGTEAFAFSISDHLAITQVALSELRTCGELDAPLRGVGSEMQLVMGDVSEDLNLVRKWSLYSHYYNPYKTLDMRRDDSSVTVTESEDKILSLLAKERDFGEITLLLGRAIHHIQDSSVPAHVVPITHTSFTDGFESLEVPQDDYSRVKDGQNCIRLAVARGGANFPSSLMQILRSNAIATLDSLKGEMTYWYQGSQASIPWNVAFWSAGKGPEFGDYGVFGNVFGKVDGMVQVDPETYVSFKATRMRAAVEATQVAVFWLEKQLSADPLYP